MQRHLAHQHQRQLPPTQLNARHQQRLLLQWRSYFLLQLDVRVTWDSSRASITQEAKAGNFK
jgi:hypothetical protein